MIAVKMISRPKSPRRQQKAVQAEIRPVLERIASDIIAQLYKEIADFTQKPEFKRRIEVSNRAWSISITYDEKSEAGKKFKYVNDGTGLRGGNLSSTYPIVPKNPGGKLKFNLPSTPKTPTPSGPTPSAKSAPKTVITQIVMHPGIEARKFTEKATNKYQGKKAGSFRGLTEAAVKRAYRKLGIYK